MKVGLCTSIENAPTAHEAGFDYVEEHVQNLLMAEQPEAAFIPNLAAVRRAALPVLAANCFFPGALKCTGPEVDLERLVRYARNVFQRAHDAGMRFIVFGSGAARQIPEGFSRADACAQMSTLLRRIAPLAEEHDVILVLECLNRKECNFINTLAEGASFVAEIDHPHLRLLADFWHMLVDGESPAEIVAHGRWIEHAHVAELAGRQAPGTSGDDFGPFLRALKEIDYGGAISFECNWTNFPDQAAASLKGFREQLRQAGLV